MSVTARVSPRVVGTMASTRPRGRNHAPQPRARCRGDTAAARAALMPSPGCFARRKERDAEHGREAMPRMAPAKTRPTDRLRRSAAIVPASIDTSSGANAKPCLLQGHLVRRERRNVPTSRPSRSLGPCPVRTSVGHAAAAGEGTRPLTSARSAPVGSQSSDRDRRRNDAPPPGAPRLSRNERHGQDRKPPGHRDQDPFRISSVRSSGSRSTDRDTDEKRRDRDRIDDTEVRRYGGRPSRGSRWRRRFTPRRAPT
jgi:hypothetical protein